MQPERIVVDQPWLGIRESKLSAFASEGAVYVTAWVHSPDGKVRTRIRFAVENSRGLPGEPQLAKDVAEFLSHEVAGM
jgi:hypothetical protein